MLIYILLPLFVLHCIFLSRVIIIRDYNWYKGEIFVAKNNTTLLLWGICLLGLAAFKAIEVGVDYPMYYGFFRDNNYLLVEIGIQFFYKLAIKYDNFFVFSIGTYLLFLIFILVGIKKNSPNFLISILFFLLSYMYFNSYNQLRQMIAVSIVFCFANYLISIKTFDKIKFIVVVSIALLFHNSAIFIFTFLFIPKKKFSSKFVIPLFITTIILYFIPGVKNAIGESLIGFSGVYAEKYTSTQYNFFTVNKEKGLLQLLPVIAQMVIVSISLYFPKYEMDLSINKRMYDLCTNLVVINLALYSLAGIEAIDRLQLYFSIFNIYYYSFLVHLLWNCKQKRNGQLFILVIVVFWFLYYLLRLSINIAGIVPYHFFTDF